MRPLPLAFAPLAASLVACSSGPAGTPTPAGDAGVDEIRDAGPPTDTDGAPPPGVDGGCATPADAPFEPTATPTTVVGAGTAASCTSAAVVAAVAAGGTITFNCGPDPHTIVLDETAKVFNDKSAKVVLDGGGKITLSGGGKRRILYMNTCDPKQVWTTSHCQDQPTPELVIQGMTFVDGFAPGTDLTAGGGAIFARGGRLRVLDSRFFGNRCEATGQDVGGGAIRAFDQSEGKPVHVVGSTFGGAGALGNRCSNGGALSSIGVSYTITNTRFVGNEATGNGANPARAGTPGGGNGGAIANDGNTYTLRVCGSTFEDNHANEGGGAIFFVSNDRSGALLLDRSTFRRNRSDGFESPGTPGIFVLASGPPTITQTTFE